MTRARLTNSRTILGLVGWLLVTATAGALGSLASVRAEDFYQQLVRPDWAPPPEIFGPVWTALYILMALAAWLVWRECGLRRCRGIFSLYIVQLGANALWSWLFFAWRQGALAFFEIIALWILILLTIVGFWRIRPLSGALLLPYLAWVSFAAVLTFAVWRLNPGLLG
jgi:translocator protein